VYIGVKFINYKYFIKINLLLNNSTINYELHCGTPALAAEGVWLVRVWRERLVKKIFYVICVFI
jgi:hypothetical protein